VAPARWLWLVRRPAYFADLLEKFIADSANWQDNRQAFYMKQRRTIDGNHGRAVGGDRDPVFGQFPICGAKRNRMVSLAQ